MSTDALSDRFLTVPWLSALPKAYRSILLVPLIGLLQFCSHSTMLQHFDPAGITRLSAVQCSVLFMFCQSCLHCVLTVVTNYNSPVSISLRAWKVCHVPWNCQGHAKEFHCVWRVVTLISIGSAVFAQLTR